MTPTILSNACTCGHQHECGCCGQETGRCHECDCLDYVPRCQNCGDGAKYGVRTFFQRLPGCDFHVCSRRCALQLEYAKELIAA